jgi:cold-inducible RNA-binding protein
MEQNLSQLGKKKRRTMMKIYVGNLSYETTDETIRKAFESFGQVTSAKVIKDKYSGQSKGFGFVEMAMQNQAQAAITSLNGKDLMGKQITVSEARPRPDQGRTGGDRMNYGGRRDRYWFLFTGKKEGKEVKKGDPAMMKIGDRFKDKTTGKIYIIRMEIDDGTLCLEGENGLGRRLIGEASLKRTCEKLEKSEDIIS